MKNKSGSDMYRGTIIENSLKDRSILYDVDIERTWTAGDWKLHSVFLRRDLIPRLSNALADGPWYIHVWQPENENNVTVIYKDKIFAIKHADKSTWKKAVEHGISLGIPERQLTFVIE